MCINKDLEADLRDRGVSPISTVAEAIAERKADDDRFHHLLDAITPIVGRATAVEISNAHAGVLGAFDREVLARLAVVMDAVNGGGAGQTYLTPLREEDEE